MQIRTTIIYIITAWTVNNTFEGDYINITNTIIIEKSKAEDFEVLRLKLNHFDSHYTVTNKEKVPS